MPALKDPATPAAPEPAAEQLPQSGGSYNRQPDGSLLPATPNPPADQE